MARVITGKESISRRLRETLAALEQGEQEEGESQLSALMRDVQRLLKPIRGSSVWTPGFAGDQVGLDHLNVKHLEVGIKKAQSYARGRDLLAATAAMRQAFDDWTR